MTTTRLPDEFLPFGRMSATVAELEGSVDRETARDVLASNGVVNPDAAITAVIEVIPDLLEWLAAHGRRYPWRETTDPWRVYVSEILLQRTRANAVRDLYDEFFDQFPNPEAIRSASDEELY